MDRDDVGVRESADDRGLSGEPGHLPIAVRVAVAGEDLDRDQAVCLGARCLPNLPEPASPDQLNEPVAPIQHRPRRLRQGPREKANQGRYDNGAPL